MPPASAAALGKPIKRALFGRSVHEVAPELVGATMLVNGVGGIIVEVEAYHHTDEAAHSFPGKTARNAVMFGPPGRLYVYRSYGIHWCVNFTCREPGHGAAVLIRALEPTHGIETMRQRRKTDNLRLLCSGPGRLCQALGITRQLNGASLTAPHLSLLPAQHLIDVITGPRIGISKAVEVPWRFGLAGSPYLSRPFKEKTV